MRCPIKMSNKKFNIKIIIWQILRRKTGENILIKNKFVAIDAKIVNKYLAESSLQTKSNDMKTIIINQIHIFPKKIEQNHQLLCLRLNV